MRGLEVLLHLEGFSSPKIKDSWTASLQPKATPCCEGKKTETNCWKQVRNRLQLHREKVWGLNWLGLCSTAFSSGGKKHLRVSKDLSAGLD